MILISDPDEIREPDMGRLVEQYGTPLLRMCFLYLKDAYLAQDAVQDTFMQVFRCYSQFRGLSGEKTWIMRIAINVCKNYLRRSWWKRCEDVRLLEEVPCDGKLPDTEGDALLLDILKLPAKYREVILLFYYQEMKIREIAEVLKIPQSTVAVRLKRARERLKEDWKEWYDDGL